MHFKIDFLDHVAIRVRDMEVSAAWYEKVLGLTRYQKEEWGPFPIFMLSGKSGIALFPAQEGEAGVDPEARGVKIDHFAFQVSRESFAAARAHYVRLGLDFEVQDHHFFHSMYTRDPDGHTVELTALVVSPGEFYGP